MPYIGQQPTNVAFLTDQFSGNGSTTAFTLSAAPANTSSILVAISGVLQDPSTYSVSGTTLTFSPAPPTGTGNISVRFLGIPASGVTTTAYRTVTEFTATAGQTTFSVPSYTVGFIDVYRNGVMLGSADYTATSGVSVVLVNGCTVGDLVEVISFQVSSVLNAISATAGSVGSSNIANGVTINFADGSASTPSITNDGDTNTGIFFPAADTIAFAEGGAEIARFDSSGNLLVGTTSASGFDSGADNLIVGGGSGSTGMTIYSGTTSVGAINFADGTSGSAIYAGGITYNHNDNRMDFATTDGSGRMRIDSNGNVLIGTTSLDGRLNVAYPSGGNGCKFTLTNSSAANNVLVFNNTNGTVGFIQMNGSNTSYNTSSDYRLKENIAPMTGALATVQALKPVTYTWKTDGSDGQGFIAHELQAVVPDCVIGEKDGTRIETYEISPAIPAEFDGEGKVTTEAVEAVMGEREVPAYQGIDVSFLVATLTAAIQEQQVLITDLTTRLTALENK